MKTINIWFLCVLFVCSANAQNRFTYFDFIEDPLRIREGEDENYFKYALTLLKQDSIVKAYQILWRVHETGKLDSKKVSDALKAAKRKIVHRYDKLLRSSWVLSFDGYSNHMRRRDSVRYEKIVISKKKIRFYGGERLTKEYKYRSEIKIDPYFGFIAYLVRYKISSEEWIYNLGKYTTKNAPLAIEPKEGAIDAKYFAVYKRIKQY